MELQRIAMSDSLNVTRENYERELKKARSSRMIQEDRIENETMQEISNWISSDRHEMRQFVKKNRGEIRELEESLERVKKETSDFRDANPGNSVRSVVGFDIISLSIVSLIPITGTSHFTSKSSDEKKELDCSRISKRGSHRSR